jgi:hypothetical protein
MSVQTIVTDEITEGATAILVFTIQDEDGVAIPGSSLDTCTLTLYDQRSRTVINAQTDTDIKALVDESGVASVELEPADTAIVNQRRALEAHVALIEWSYDGGTKAGKHEILHTVRNLAKVG